MFGNFYWKWKLIEIEIFRRVFPCYFREHLSKIKETKWKAWKTIEKMAKINGALLCEYLLGWLKMSPSSTLFMAALGHERLP